MNRVKLFLVLAGDLIEFDLLTARSHNFEITASAKERKSFNTLRGDGVALFDAVSVIFIDIAGSVGNVINLADCAFRLLACRIEFIRYAAVGDEIARSKMSDDTEPHIVAVELNVFFTVQGCDADVVKCSAFNAHVIASLNCGPFRTRHRLKLTSLYAHDSNS